MKVILTLSLFGSTLELLNAHLTPGFAVEGPKGVFGFNGGSLSVIVIEAGLDHAEIEPFESLAIAFTLNFFA
jgi:hypothetical protein